MKTGWKTAFTVTAIIVTGSVVFSAIAFHKRTCHVCGEKECAINVCPRCSCGIFGTSLSRQNQD